MDSSISLQIIMKEGFLISSKMLKDHLCDSVTTALEQSLESLKPKSIAKTPHQAVDVTDDSSSDDE